MTFEDKLKLSWSITQITYGQKVMGMSEQMRDRYKDGWIDELMDGQVGE